MTMVLRDFAEFIQAGIVHDYEKVKDELESNPCDVILLCNPGGSPKTNLTMQEEKWLRWGNLSVADSFEQLYFIKGQFLQKCRSFSPR